MSAYLTPTLTSAALHPLFQLMRERGLNPDELPELAKDWGSSQLQFPVPVFDRIVEQAGQFLKTPAIGVMMGSRLDWRRFRLLAYLLSECRTGRDALSQLRRYYPLISDSHSPDVFIGQQAVKVVFYVSEGGAQARQTRAELVAAGIHDVGSRLGNGFYNITGIGFQQQPPQYRDQLDRYFGVPVRYGESCNWISFSSDYLDKSMKKAMPFLEAMLEGAEVPWRSEDTERPFSRKLRHILYYWPTCLPMTKEAVADLLGTSARTLTRRLQEEGSQFSELSKHCRLVRAAAALKRTSKDVQQLANELGFSDRRGFERAFKQWTGQTPAAFRRQWRNQAVAAVSSLSPLESNIGFY
ncbi:AraC family transcriptional regulator [Oceanobacter sp. 3_MG-2023]|uniref:AraC family transcriptional regulator n=1 Tax=Oceanobacter sp. 3_MG-2023 TaxID=3062622 RepID=UPI002734895B|nr:AraC family transcriptional regulator [Oceanobacter sp. 3_MG-2023]MDP2506485.1 AraC family transcriptional regulator ligand-binding domain-containing protein [Oceanobacter sp. 3_MG-2023]